MESTTMFANPTICCFSCVKTLGASIKTITAMQNLSVLAFVDNGLATLLFIFHGSEPNV